MNPELQQLVRETIELTDSAPPELLDELAPVLSENALAEGDFYLVGMIGGKEVGKSALVNALMGQTITASTSFGPGTELVIAYAHQSQVESLQKLLEREVPRQYRIIPHTIGHLSGQVLLDLPDIDSHWAGHIELTRRMLRHLLFPLWVQSVEKYADRQPQELLARVAQGNSTDNFLFCLNKADQLKGPASAGEELRNDYSQRIARTLRIEAPKVWLLSAAAPEQFDLPELRQLVSRQKSGQIVRQSQQLAARQQDRSIFLWIDAQNLPARAERLERLQQEAEELLAARIAVPLLEQSLPALADDPASQLALTDELLAVRASRWPIVNLVHTLLTPVLAVVRRNVGAVRTASLPDAEALVEAHLRPCGTPLATLVRSTFAQLQQTHAQISELYRQRKLWEDMSADLAAVQLRASLTDTISQQRELVRRRLTGKWAMLTAPLRWLLTIGAALWFPFVQPTLQTILDKQTTHSTHDIVVMTVNILSVNQLLQNLTFLTMYFLLLWIILRWDTYRRVARMSRRWKSDTSELSLGTVTVDWLDELLRPIRGARETANSLAERAKKLAEGAADHN